MSTGKPIPMNGVREGTEGNAVELDYSVHTGRLCVVARRDDGTDAAEVDLLDLLRWIRDNKPELLYSSSHELLPHR